MTAREQTWKKQIPGSACYGGAQGTRAKPYMIKDIDKRTEFYVPATDATVGTHGSPLWIDKNKLDEALAGTNMYTLPRDAIVEFLFLVGLGWPTSVAAELKDIGPTATEALLNPDHFAVCVDAEDESLRGIGKIWDPAYWTAFDLYSRRRIRSVQAHNSTRMGPAPAPESYAPLSECLLRGRVMTHSVTMPRESGEEDSLHGASSHDQLLANVLVLGLVVEPFLRDDSNRMLSPSLAATLLEEEIGMTLCASLAAYGLANRSSRYDGESLKRAQKVFRAAKQHTRAWEKQVRSYNEFHAHAGTDPTWREFLDFVDSISEVSKEVAGLPPNATSALERHLKYRTADKAKVSSSALPAKALLEHMRLMCEPSEDIAGVEAAISALAEHGVTSVGAIANLTCEDVFRLGVEDHMVVSCLMHATYECLAQPWLAPAPPEAHSVNDSSIDCLSLDTRSRNCLKRAKVSTVAQLMKLNDDELLALPNFGVGSLGKVREALNAHQAAHQDPDADCEVIRRKEQASAIALGGDKPVTVET